MNGPFTTLSLAELNLIRQIAEAEAAKVYDNKVRFWLHPTLMVFIAGTLVAATAAIVAALMFPDRIVSSASTTLRDGVIRHVQEQIEEEKKPLSVLQTQFSDEIVKAKQLVDELRTHEIDARFQLQQIQADAATAEDRTQEVLGILNKVASEQDPGN